METIIFVNIFEVQTTSFLPDSASIQAASDERHGHAELRHRVHRRVGRTDAAGRRGSAVRILGHFRSRRSWFLTVLLSGSKLRANPLVRAQQISFAYPHRIGEVVFVHNQNIRFFVRVVSSPPFSTLRLRAEQIILFDMMSLTQCHRF